MYRLKCIEYNVQSTMYRCTQYTAHCRVYAVRCSLHAVHCTLNTIRCTMYAVHCTLSTVHCTLYTVHCTLYTVHCALYTGHWTLYTGHWTMRCLVSRYVQLQMIKDSLFYFLLCTQDATSGTSVRNIEPFFFIVWFPAIRNQLPTSPNHFANPSKTLLKTENQI